MHLDAVHWLIAHLTIISIQSSMSDALSHLDGQYGRLLLVEDVPGVQDPVLPRREEHGGPGGAPAPVSQVLRVRAEVRDGQETITISVPAPGPHNGALLDVL